MATKSLEQKIEALTSIVEKGFAKQGKEIKDLTESVAFVVTHMATKDNVRTIVREETKDIRAELASIRRDLTALSRTMENSAGLTKEIDHALERIAAIEKHLGINKKIAA